MKWAGLDSQWGGLAGQPVQPVGWAGLDSQWGGLAGQPVQPVGWAGLDTQWGGVGRAGQPVGRPGWTASGAAGLDSQWTSQTGLRLGDQSAAALMERHSPGASGAARMPPPVSS